MKKLTGFLMCCLVSLTVQAEVPALINYQGQLLDAQGAPLPDGDYTLTFHVFDSAAGGAPVWGPQIFDGAGALGHGAKVPLIGGFLSVILGDKDVADRSIADAFDGSVRYLEITVAANSPMAPRQRIVSGPFALRAERVNRIDASTDIADGHIVDSDITNLSATKLDSGTISEARLPQGAIDGSEIEDGSLSGADIQDESITGDDIQDGSVTGTDISTGTISLDRLAAAVQSALCPPGTILSYAGDAAPSGWLLCNGTPHYNTSYAALYAVIGNRFGSGTSNGEPYFFLPDLRGRFLRGRDGGAGRDPDRAARVSMFPGGATGDAVGSVQWDQLRSHTHTYKTTDALHNADDGSGGYYEIKTFDYAAVTSATGGNETRPVNVYVNYIIKY